MRGCSSAIVFVVNAEVDSMGGVGISNKTSPLKAAIEKVQAELWQEYGVRDQRKKELEFLEKGGDPLDFKLRTGALVSVQSTSISDQHPDQFVTSEAKGSLFTASPYGDSAESSGRPGTTREPNSADNLMLYAVEHGFSEGGRSLSHPSRSDVAPSKQSFKVYGSHKTQEQGDSATFNIPRKAYKRRYRSRPNHDGVRSSSTDINPTRSCDDSSLPSRHGPSDVKGLVSDVDNQNLSLDRNLKPTSIMDDTLPKTAFRVDQDDIGFDNVRSVESTKDLNKGASVDAASDAIASKNSLDKQINLSPSAAAKTPNQVDSSGTEAIQAKGEITSPGIECQPSATATEVENQSSSCQMNGFRVQKGDVKNDAHNSNISRSVKVLCSESSCMRTSINNDSGMFTGVRNVDPNGNLQNQTSRDGNPVIESDKCVKEKKDEGIDNSILVNKESASACQSQHDNGFSHQLEEELGQSATGFENKAKDQVIIEGMEACGRAQVDSGRKHTDPSIDNLELQNETSNGVRHRDSVEFSNAMPEARLLTKTCTVPVEAQTSSGSESKLASKIDEDSILKEAQIIEEKRKMIAELSIVTSPTEMRRKSHWDYVLEEMAWLANDFAQERIWKLAAVSQISYRVWLRKQGKRSDMDAKTVAHTLAKAVTEFWQSVQSQDASKELEPQRQKNGALSVRAYAVRLLKFIKPNIFLNQAEVPSTPDRTSDLGILDLSWEDNLPEENLFYTVLPGAGETYRKSVESHVAHREKIGSTVQEEAETPMCVAAADFEYQDNANAYDVDVGETSTYNTALALESSKSSRYGQMKRKNLAHAYGSRTYELGSDLLPNAVIQQSAFLSKRPASTLDVPTKRVRTAIRKVISPFTAGASGGLQLPNKTDASSCDTNSFQDDRGLLFENSLEVESAREFENQLPFDLVEVSTRPKKKKKAKHLNAGYDQRWQVDSSFQNEQFQRDPARKRSESRQLESNGNIGLLGQPMMKKLKLMRQSQDNSFDNIPPSGGSAPSPVASQMSNMSNPNKFKMLGGRDRGRKSKALKMPAGQSGPGGPWSLFEDQALVVLVHDLGPNWELVSDAINSTLHFKYIFRKSKECKERHNLLMDGTGYGAECAEDSESQQAYPSTLPGIPKGSARQLFQRLQGPMEEDTLKSHFEKIIMIGQKPRFRKTQEPKQLQQPHSSQPVALSQVSPNNLNGAHILTPLDLCDASVSGPDLLSLGYQGPDSSGLANPNQGTMNLMPPASGAHSALQGSPNMMTGNKFSSSPGTLNPSARDGRYAGPRPGSLPPDEQHRLHQYNNQMIPGRNIPQPNISAPTNRSLPMARPGFQGIPPSSLVNSGSMVSPVTSSANMHAGQGSSTLKPRENLHMVQPGPNHYTQSQTTMPDLQIPGNSHGPSRFSSPISPFPNQLPSVPVPSYPLHHHPHFQGPPPPNQPPDPQQHAYAVRLAKERHLQHRLLQQRKQQHLASSSNRTMPHVQSQPQLPVSPPLQNNSPQTSSQPTQGGIGGGLTNQTVKQRQMQKNQINRQHPQQRQQPKVARGVDRGNMTSISSDASLLNGVSTNPGQYSASQSTNLKMASQFDNSSSQQTPHQQKLANQNQSINSDPSNKLHVRECDTGQQPTNSSAEMDTLTILTQVSNSTTNAVQVAVHKPQQTVPPLHSQQQAQLLQRGNGNLCGRSSEPRLE